MPVLPYIHQLFKPNNVKYTSTRSGGKSARSNVPGVRPRTSIPGAITTTDWGCKRYWCNGCQRTFNDLTDTLLH